MNRKQRRALEREQKKTMKGPSDRLQMPPLYEILRVDGHLFGGTRQGQINLLPAEELKELVPHEVLRAWCYMRAVYGVPTFELVEWLREYIDGRSAIEIGSGYGYLGRALGISMTDNYCQDFPDVATMYDAMNQPRINYPDDVEKLDAVEAVKKYNPQVVIGQWVTHWIDPNKPMPPGGGNMYGVKEELILDHPSVEAYVLVGNWAVHRHKPLLEREYEVIKEDWIVSRSKYPEQNCIIVWRRK